MDDNNNEKIGSSSTVEPQLSDKNKVIAALLCFFLGGLGIHRFYLGWTGSAIAMLVLSILGTVLSAIIIGIPLLLIVGIWDIVDFFRIIFGSLTDAQGRKLC